MGESYLLTLPGQSVRRLLAGSQKWEFQEDPGFGWDGARSLEPGDAVLLVAEASRAILGRGRVEAVLRGGELQAYFQQAAAGRWLSSGSPAVQAFTREVLGPFQAAVRLACQGLDRPLALDRVRQRDTGLPWAGPVLAHLSRLAGYLVDGREAGEVLARMAEGRAGDGKGPEGMVPPGPGGSF